MTNVNSWKLEALCADVDPHKIDFFSMSTSERKKCLAICNECPVRTECLENALEHDEIWGIWGGTLEEDRRRAMSINENFEPHRYEEPLSCLLCNSFEIEVVERRRSRIVNQCKTCKLEWQARRTPRKRRVQSEDSM